MSVAYGVKPVTAEDFQQFDPEWRYDLIEGELVPMPPLPGEEHGIVTFDFALEVGSYAKAHRLGQCYASETRFIVARRPDTVLAPDLAFTSAHRLPAGRSRGFVEVIPDLVLEVRSPSDRPAAVAGEVSRWLDAGVRLVWELDVAKRALTVHRPGRDPRFVGLAGEIDGEDVLPGFRLPMRSLFPDNPPSDR